MPWRFRPLAAVGGSVSVLVGLTNVGPRAGDEVVQLYVKPDTPSRRRPVKELKGFKKVHLAPETATIELTLAEPGFSFFDDDQNRWVAEGSAYEILIGASASDIRLSKSITLTTG